MNTNTTAATRMFAPIDTEERLVAGDAHRTIRKPAVRKPEFSRLSDGQTHPVTISRKYA